MSLRLYNTLTRQKEVFRPIDAADVRVYACGPTVYDHLHIGNGRMLIVFDLLFRVLRHIYGPQHVKYIRNITDVDDKINARAAERGVDIRALTDEMTAIFHADAAALGCLPPTLEPRATDNIKEMIAIIERLIAKGNAYVAADDGGAHVLFDVPSMPDYGQLSKRPLDEMIAGARVEVAPYKRGPMDFVLWKPSAPHEPGWDSPWGRGRPGWHIECSAMSWKYLGETFDIHGGGIDLLFPHHENEVAQTRCAFGHDMMANIWMHNGHLQVEGEKMSKSVGNFVTIHELLHTDKFGGRSWPGEVLRLAMLKTHYRQPIDFTLKALEEAENTCGEWYVTTHNISDRAAVPQAVLEPLRDDLNTPATLAAMYELNSKSRALNRNAAVQLKSSLELLGIGLQHENFGKWLLRYPSALAADLSSQIGIMPALAGASAADVGYLGAPAQTVELITREYLRTIGLSEDKLNKLIVARNAARSAKNWAESDRIRDELDAMGVAVKDNKDGTTSWEPKR